MSQLEILAKLLQPQRPLANDTVQTTATLLHKHLAKCSCGFTFGCRSEIHMEIEVARTKISVSTSCFKVLYKSAKKQLVANSIKNQSCNKQVDRYQHRTMEHHQTAQLKPDQKQQQAQAHEQISSTKLHMHGGDLLWLGISIPQQLL